MDADHRPGLIFRQASSLANAHIHLTPALPTNSQVTPGAIFVGCSGWAYATWKPGFYPAKLSSKKFLEYYGSRLNSVEVNYTFRSLPSANTMASWLGTVGEGFRFSFKAPQRITHFLRLKSCGEALASFAASIQAAADARRLGIILFQLPPNFKADVSRLDEFLAESKSTGLRFAFEFRHASWFADEVYAVLRNHESALCMAESDELVTPDIETAAFACYRFRKSDYDTRALEAVHTRLQQRAQSGDVFAYFKHEEEPTGALHAAALLEGLRNI